MRIIFILLTQKKFVVAMFIRRQFFTFLPLNALKQVFFVKSLSITLDFFVI